MPNIEETGPQNDPNEGDDTPPVSKTSEQSQENKSCGPEDQPPVNHTEGPAVTSLIQTVKEASELSVAHEIIVNQDFHIEESVLQPNSGESQTMERMYNAFWNHLKEQLSSTPPDFTYALELLEKVKETLLSLLLPRQNRLRNEIEEALDMDLLKQQTEHGALDVPRLSSCILNLMTLLCAPVRDEEMKKLKSIKDPVDLLRDIFRVLGLMKVDMVNYTIQNLRPYLQEYSVEYERSKFQKLLEKQPNLLHYTTKWLTKAAADLSTPPPGYCNPPIATSTACSSPNLEAISLETSSPTMVIYQGYLNLLFLDDENEEFPETLLMDRVRLKDMGSRLNQLTILASVLLVARSLCGSVLFSSPKFVDKLKSVSKALTEEFSSRAEEAMLSVSEQVSQEIHQGLKDIGLTPLNTDQIVSLKGQLQNIAKKDNCVRTIIDQRIRLFLKRSLVHGIRESLLQFPGGLIFIKEDLTEIGSKFVRLMHHNQQVFGPHYAEILKNIIRPAQEKQK